MSNEIKITVSGDNRTGPMFTSAKNDVDKFFRDILARAARSSVEMKAAGDKVGKAFGEGIQDGIKSKGSTMATETASLLGRAEPQARINGGRIGKNLGDGIRRGAKEGLDKIRREIVEWVTELRIQLALQGAQIGQVFGNNMAREFKQALRQLERSALETYLRMAAEAKIAGHEIGNKLGDGMRGGVGSLSVKLGTQMGKSLGSKVSKVFGDVFSLSITNPYLWAAAIAAMPAIGALLADALLLGAGGVVLGAGVAAAWKDPDVSGDKKPRQEEYTKGLDKATAKYEAAHARWVKLMALQGSAKAKKSALYDERMAQMDMAHFKKALADLDKEAVKGFAKVKEHAKTVWERFGDWFKPSAVKMMDNLVPVVDKMGPVMQGMAATMAPVLDKLVPALGAFVTNMMPGFQDALEAAVPVFNALSESLPGLGDDMSRFFQLIADSGPGATQFMADFVEILGKSFIAIGYVVKGLSAVVNGMHESAQAGANLFVAMGTTILSVLTTIVDGIVATFGSLPFGVGDAVKASAVKFYEFRATALGVFEDISNRFNDPVYLTPKVNMGAADATERWIDNLARPRFVHFIAGSPPSSGSASQYAHGGIVGAATGGVHSGMRLVGEQGPELVNLAPGSKVTPAGATRNMLNGQGSHEKRVIELTVNAILEGRILKDFIKQTVSIDGGGSVQAAFG